MGDVFSLAAPVIPKTIEKAGPKAGWFNMAE